MSLKQSILDAIHAFEAKLKGDAPELDAQAAQALEELKTDATNIIDGHEAAAAEAPAEEAPPAG